MAMRLVTVTGEKGSTWRGEACVLPFGKLAQLGGDYQNNPDDDSESAVTFETDKIIWNA